MDRFGFASVLYEAWFDVLYVGWSTLLTAKCRSFRPSDRTIDRCARLSFVLIDLIPTRRATTNGGGTEIVAEPRNGSEETAEAERDVERVGVDEDVRRRIEATGDEKVARVGSDGVKTLGEGALGASVVLWVEETDGGCRRRRRM